LFNRSLEKIKHYAIASYGTCLCKTIGEVKATNPTCFDLDEEKEQMQY
jgi:hypothetical protein